MRLHQVSLGSGTHDPGSLATAPREAGGRPPLVVLHGLFGSSRNWLRVGRELARSFDVMLLDLRNHGESPHSSEHSLRAMAGDVAEWIDATGLDRVRILGHSLGGKVAMRFACDRPERVAHLTVVDIAPKDYPPVSRELDALRALDLASLGSRVEAERALEAGVPDRSLRLFLLTNLRRRGGGFRWQANLDALAAGLPDMRRSPLEPGERHEGPTHFLLGADSSHVRPEDHARIRAHFPRAHIETLPDAGHNPHVDVRDAFVAAVERQLEH